MKLIITLLLFIINVLVLITASGCPISCTCKLVGPQSERLKVKCNENIQNIKEIDINSVSIELYHLDFSKNNIHNIDPGIFSSLTNLKRLDLPNNKITSLLEGAFAGLINLERLDLSKNQISSIDPFAFRQLYNLKKLDLSFNKISAVVPILFHDLLALDRLKLNGNSLKTLGEGTFHSLKSLRQVDLSDNPWVCDCYIYWLTNWKNTSLIKFVPSPVCDSPLNLNGQLISELKNREDFECELTSPFIEINPNENQVVFAGDTLSLKCSAPSITDDKSAKLRWLWHPSTSTDEINPDLLMEPMDKLSNIEIDNNELADSGLVGSTLNINQVKDEHNGQWSCLLVSIYGNRSRALSIIVISDKTNYCPLTITKNNKGTYIWPRTVNGWQVELPCEGNTLTSLPLYATYQCNLTGNWVKLNTNDCPYISQITKSLDQLSKIDLSLSKNNLLDTLKRINYTIDPKKLLDPIDLNFITKIIENYINFLPEEKELSTVLIDIISSMMYLNNNNILQLSQINYNSCYRLIKCIEIITKYTPTIQIHKNNFALEEFDIKRDNFIGLKCTWYSNNNNNNKLNDDTSRSLHCATNNRTAILSIKDRTIEASIQLPGSLLKNTETTNNPHQLMITMYNNSNLFQYLNLTGSKMKISSNIISSKIINLPLINLTEPVLIVLKLSDDYHMRTLPKPIVWDINNTNINNNNNNSFNNINNTNNNHDDDDDDDSNNNSNVDIKWTSRGCDLLNLINNLVFFQCDRLGYYAVLEDISYINNDSMIKIGEKFRYCNPAIYIGTFIIIITLTFTSITYIIFYTSIVMPKKTKHSIINTWISIILLTLIYTSGIQQTENIKICQSVGLILHYLSLCCLLWMAVSISNMYKRLSKSDVRNNTLNNNDDEAISDDEDHIEKPLLGLYLVGWGIGLIICGISGAINLHQYAGQSYCFLTSPPALAALFIPAGILSLYLIIFYLLIKCSIRSIDNNGQLSEGTQATEHMDLELLEPHDQHHHNHHINKHRQNLDQNSINTGSSEIEDIEHSQLAQLKGHIILLILFIIMWCSGAAATTKPFTNYLYHEELIFSIIYCLSASCLGLFVLLFYGLARNDVRSQWSMMKCWLKNKKNHCCRGRNVSDTNPSIPSQPLVQNPSISAGAGGGVNSVGGVGMNIALSMSQVTQAIISDNNSLTSSRHTNTQSLKVSDISDSDKIPNVNLIVLHRKQYRTNNKQYVETKNDQQTVEMFYNPHQSGVARKFFKKQRKHNIKNNNLINRKAIVDCSITSDGGGSCISIPRPVKPTNNITNDFGSNVKVNNINIHVELNSINHHKNKNNVNMLTNDSNQQQQQNTNNIPIIINKSNKKINNESSMDQYNPHSDSDNNKIMLLNDDEDVNRKVKQLRNVSQQCSSDVESPGQVISEKGNNNSTEMCEREIPEANNLSSTDPPSSTSSLLLKSSNLNQLNHDKKVEVNKKSADEMKNVELNDYSTSLYCLSNVDDYSTAYASTKSNYTSSFINIEKDESISSNNFNNPSNDEEENEEEGKLIQRNQQLEAQQQQQQHSQYLSDSLTSGNKFTGSLSNVNCLSNNSDNNFTLIDDFTLPNLTEKVDLINRKNNLPNFLHKEFNSLNDLTNVDVPLGATRHLDINASIGVDYEDINYSNSEPYNDDHHLDDEVLIETNNSIKKETSV